MRFLTTVLLLFTLVFYILYHRIVAPLSEQEAVFQAVRALGIMILGSLLWWILFFVRSTDPNIRFHERILEKLTHLSMAYISKIIFMTLVRDFILIVSILIPFNLSIIHEPISSLWILGVSGFLVFMGYIQAKRTPIIRNIRLQDSRVSGLRIVQISDLHIGSWIGEKDVRRIVEKIKSLGPIDLLIFTGDIGDGDPVIHQKDLEPFREVQTRIGKYAVSGNHEGYWNEEAWNENLKRLEFKLLENESVEIQTDSYSFSIHGLRDYKPDPKRALEKLDPSLFSIFLTHQPKHAKIGIDAGVSLQLSGHTHAGQFIPWNLIIGWFHQYPKGFYEIGKTRLFVHSGTGFWGPPTRLGTRSEIALIEII